MDNPEPMKVVREGKGQVYILTGYDQFKNPIREEVFVPDNSKTAEIKLAFGKLPVEST